jgi:signal transduction histidine kinase
VDGARIEWTLDLPRDLRARIDRDDLTEALGALLENAARHARSEVIVSAACDGDAVAVTIRDDGPGIPTSMLEALLARGARLDAAGTGAGLGLSIASEITEAAGGMLVLRNADPGLEARLVLPRAPHPV